MKFVLTAFFMAWGMFWVVPCPLKWWDEDARTGMLMFLPVVGLLIGLVWAGCVFLIEKYIPGTIGAALCAIIPFILSGFIHLDGYMDCADAVLSRRDLETRRKILKDSHIGSFAAVALAVLLLVEYSAFSGYTFGGKVWCLPAVCSAPRAFSSCAVMLLKPLPGSSYEKMFADGVPDGAKIASVAILGLMVLTPILLYGRIGLCAAFGVLGTLVSVAYIRHDLGGMSGDVSGAGITVGELCGLIALALL